MKRLCLFAVLLSGCGLENIKYKGDLGYPPNPFPDIQVVAILPFANLTADPRLNTDEFSNICASEMLKFAGFRVIRPILVRAAANPQEPLRTADDALRLGRQIKADAILVAAVTDYDPYNPPKVAVSVQFLRVAGRHMSDADIDRIVQSASWRRGPLEMTRDKAGNWIGSFETVYDAHEERIRDEAEAYDDAQVEGDHPFDRGQEVVAVQSRWLQFVSNQVINQIIRSGKNGLP